MKSKFYATLILLMLFFIVVPPSLGATMTAYNPMEYLTEEEQAYVKEMRGAIDAARGAITDAKAELIPIFPEGYEKWVNGFTGKVSNINKTTEAMGAIPAPSAFSAVQAQAGKIGGYDVGWVGDMFNPMVMQSDLAQAMKTFADAEASFNSALKEVEAVSSTLEKTVAEVAKKQKMGADIVNAMLSCDETAT